jgi:hypothetical protein
MSKKTDNPIDIALVCPSMADYPGLCNVAAFLKKGRLNPAFFYSENLGKIKENQENSDFLHLDLDENKEIASKVKVVLSNDSVHVLLKYFPVAKIVAFNHAFPANLGMYSKKQLFQYNQYAGLYDYYLLTGSIDNKITADELSAHFTDIYPSQFVEKEIGTKHKESLTFIPTGYLRQDHYNRLFQEQKTKKASEILFAPGYSQQFFSPDLFNTHAQILTILIQNFPDHLIVYRPFPCDTKEAEVKKIVKNFSSFSNFKFDTSANAAVSYYKYALLVTDHSEIYISYGLATDRNSIRYSKGRALSHDDFGFCVGSLDELSIVAKNILKADNTKKNQAKVRLYKQTPDTEKHFAQVILMIANGKSLPSWYNVSTAITAKNLWKGDFNQIQAISLDLLNKNYIYPVGFLLQKISSARLNDALFQAFHTYIKCILNRGFKDNLIHTLQLPNGRQILKEFPFPASAMVDVVFELVKSKDT